MFRVALSCAKRCRGHLTNTKQSHVNSDAAQALASSLKDVLHRTDLIIFPLTLQTITIAPVMSI